MFDAPRQWLMSAWPVPPNVQAVVTTREGPAPAFASPWGFNVGTHCGDDPARVTGHRAYLREALALPSSPHWLRQVHAARCIGVDRDTVFDELEADAAVTRTPGVVLAIQTADCLPVLLCSANGAEIAAAHAGWRGLAAGVLENTVAAMDAPQESILAWLGPAIGPASYEVGDEVRDAFRAHDAAASAAFTPTRPGHWLCDLYQLARQRLYAAGITRIHGGGFDTFTDSRFHSFRRDRGHSGRMASLVWLDP